MNCAAGGSSGNTASHIETLLGQKSFWSLVLVLVSTLIEQM